MNIAIFIKRTTLHKGYGGMEIQNQILCEEFAKNGHTVTIFCPKWDLNKELETLNNVNYVFINAPYKLSRQSKWISKSVETFTKFSLEKKFDIVFSQSSAALGIIRNKKELNVKVISICHGSALGEYKTLVDSFKKNPSVKGVVGLVRNGAFVFVNYFGRQREFILHSNKVIAVSEFVKKSVIEETFVPDDKVVVIKNGVVPPVLEIQKDQNTINLIYVGQLLESKGVLNLLSAFNKLSKSVNNIMLTIIGDGPLFEIVRENASKNPKISYLGKLSHGDVLIQLCKSHIFILPSLRQEGLPMSIVEAMFCKSVVVASDVGGISDVVNSETGVLIKQGNIEDLYNTLEELVNDKQKVISLSESAFKYAQNELTSYIMYRKYLEVIQSL